MLEAIENSDLTREDTGSFFVDTEDQRGSVWKKGQPCVIEGQGKTVQRFRG